MAVVLSTTVGALANPGTVAAAPAATTGSCGDAPTYTVLRGDSWYGIAREVAVKPGALMQANDATVDQTILPGETLCLPAGAILPGPPPAPVGEETSGTAVPAPADAACVSTYTVVAGDSWFAIAKAVGVKASALTAANDATFVRVLFFGDVLCLPPGATPVVVAPPAAAPVATAAPDNCAFTYSVRSGDSWFGLAQRAGVGTKTLTAANDAAISDALHPGDALCLPESAKSLVIAPPPVTSVELAAAPLQGPCGYGDTWRDARGDGRTHEGVDMFAAPGNYIYAVADGILTRRVWDQPGIRSGNAWWLRATDGSGTSFFYAHLMDFAPGLEVGMRVRAGQIIGFLGGTGNAGGPHLHFEIHPNGGDAINPYDSVKSIGGCKTGDAYEQPTA